MKIENQVCTISQSIRLHELGVEKHISLLSYWPNPKVLKGGAVEHDGTYTIMLSNHKRTYASAVKDSAFTVAELGIMLPSETYAHRNGSEDSEYANWEWVYDGEEKAWGMFETMAQAMADCLITLIENKIITIQEVNKRLSQA